MNESQAFLALGLLFGILAKQQDIEGWKIVFNIVAIIYMVASMWKSFHET